MAGWQCSASYGPSAVHPSCRRGAGCPAWCASAEQPPPPSASSRLASHVLSMALRCRLRVFSYETGPQGKRRFLVTSYATLWRRYRDLLPQHRHYYEIIREGWPCHLYFGECKAEKGGGPHSATKWEMCGSRGGEGWESYCRSSTAGGVGRVCALWCRQTCRQ